MIVEFGRIAHVTAAPCRQGDELTSSDVSSVVRVSTMRSNGGPRHRDQGGVYGIN